MLEKPFKWICIIVLIITIIIGLLLLSSNSEARVANFCNDLVIGEKYIEVFTRAKNIDGAKLSKDENDKKIMLKSKGYVIYNWCSIEFEDEKLSKKTLSLT